MAKQLITIGTPGAGGGDPAHAAFKKINDNATELYNAAIPDTEEKKTQARANLGLGTAATKNVGTAAGNLLEVGGLGLGGDAVLYPGVGSAAGFEEYHKKRSGFFFSNTPGISLNGGVLPQYAAYMVSVLDGGGFFGIGGEILGKEIFAIQGAVGNSAYPVTKYALLHTGIYTVDGNGFIKSASPVVKLFADKIELNSEGQLQDITFEKLGVGDYLVKGSLGFAQIGWYIEMPKDANGNVLVAVVYEQLENNDISVKTYAKKFDDETGDIVANLTKPRDIPAGRWIDIRLQELPQPEVQISESNTPPDFQPTNLAQAVAEALNYDSQ